MMEPATILPLRPPADQALRERLIALRAERDRLAATVERQGKLIRSMREGMRWKRAGWAAIGMAGLAAVEWMGGWM